jgi:hypothetical protein
VARKIQPALPSSRSFGCKGGHVFRNKIKKGSNAERQMLAVCTDGEEVADDPRAPFIKQPPLSGKFERPGSVLGQAELEANGTEH